MTVLAIFNPEHDLCLSNGSPNFVPPSSALLFAQKGTHWMYDIGGMTVTEAVNVQDAPSAFHRLSATDTDVRIVAWGWNVVLLKHLIKAGVPPSYLPSEQTVMTIRQLSHRHTALPMQPDVREALTFSDIENFLSHQRHIVMKAPWSGAGRGLHWVDDRLTPHDEGWARKIIATQGSVMVEPRREVVQNFAFLFHTLPDGQISFVGYSLFDTQNGVYRGNRLMTDDGIESYLSQWVSRDELTLARQSIQQGLSALTASCGYHGPMGVDAFVYRENNQYFIRKCVEINFRYTMGFIAHERMRRNPDLLDSFWNPMY